MTQKWDGIAIHHTVSTDTDEHKDTDAIRKYHIEERGWSDIGYNGLVESINGKYSFVNGRGTSTQGAHVAGHNNHLLGLAFVGTYSDKEPPRSMLETGANILFNWTQEFGIPLNQIKGHNSWPGTNKDCPGKAFPMTRLKNLVKKRYRNYLAEKDEWSVQDQQRALSLIDIDPGPIDGIMGNRTRDGLTKANDKLLSKASKEFSSQLRSKIMKRLNNRKESNAELERDLARLEEQVDKCVKELKKIKDLYSKEGGS